MTEFNKVTNNNVYHYLEGKYFTSIDPNLQTIIIKNIVEKEGQYIVSLKQNITCYEEKYNSIMKLFEYYCNQGYRLHL